MLVNDILKLCYENVRFDKNKYLCYHNFRFGGDEIFMNMNYFIFWIGTIIGSFGAELVNELRMFKDIADAGYKVDLKKMADFQNKLMPDANKVNLLSMLIPVYNIMNVCKNIINYNNVRPMLLDQLNAMGALEEMTAFEKEEYAKKPTALNALIIPLKTEVKIASALKLTTTDDNGTNTYYFDYKTKKSIVFLKVDGPESMLPFEEQEKKAMEKMYKVCIHIRDNYGTAENYVKSLHNNSKEFQEEQNIDIPTQSQLNNNEVKEEIKQTQIVLEQKEEVQTYELKETNIDDKPLTRTRKIKR